LTQITASLSVLLWAFEPILILALAALVLGDRVGLAIVGPSIAAVAGIALVLFDPGASGSVLGVALTIAGVVACAIYTVATRRWILGTDATFPVVLSQQIHALGFAVLVLIALAASGEAMIPDRVSGAGLASAAVSGLLYYSFAYAFYLSALRRVRASVAAASFYLIPVFGVAAAWLSGERLQPLQWAGAVVVILSVATITIRSAGGQQPDDDRRPAPGQPSSAAASTQIAVTPSASRRA
jgi:drug/metabolite transporter (DMT)-like permease